MNLIDQLGVALGLATLAGLNLYLTVAVTGLAIRFGWVELSGAYAHLAELGNPWIITAAVVMFLIEFLADKIPWLDSLWDSVHTIIRPAGGIVLALTALGDLNPVAATIAALLAGGASLSTHGTKSGLRAFINLSPEPVTNSAASVTEDGFVLGGLALIAFSPFIAFFVAVVGVVLCAAAALWLWKRIFSLRHKRDQEILQNT